jgi:hypothetical protein
MPAKSKAQFRLFQAVAHGNAQLPGLSKKEAKEYVSHNKKEMSYKNLPESKERFKNLKKYLKKSKEK